MLVGVTGEHLQEDDTIGAHLDHLGNRWIGIVVADDEVAAPLDGYTRFGVPKIAVGESLVNAGEVNPHLPGACLAHGPIVAAWVPDDNGSRTPARVGLRGAEAPDQAIEGRLAEVRQDDVVVRRPAGREEGKPRRR